MQSMRPLPRFHAFRLGPLEWGPKEGRDMVNRVALETVAPVVQLQGNRDAPSIRHCLIRNACVAFC